MLNSYELLYKCHSFPFTWKEKDSKLPVHNRTYKRGPLMENNSLCHLLPKLLKQIPHHGGETGRASLISGRGFEGSLKHELWKGLSTRSLRLHLINSKPDADTVRFYICNTLTIEKCQPPPRVSAKCHWRHLMQFRDESKSNIITD